MKKPYTICHLASTVDGEILAENYLKNVTEHDVVFRQLCDLCNCDKLEFDCLMLEGGDDINNALLQADLIDEVRILVFRIKDDAANTHNMFENSSSLQNVIIQKFKLTEVNPLGNNMVWLKYQLRNSIRPKQIV